MHYFQEISVVRQESASYSSGAKSILGLVLVNKVLWAHSQAHSFPRCSRGRDQQLQQRHVTHKAKNIYYLTLHRKRGQHPVARDAEMFDSLRGT